MNNFSPTVERDDQRGYNNRLPFVEAIELMFDDPGTRLHRLEWGDVEYYGIVIDGLLKLHKPDGKFYDWIISDGDYAGRDYIIL